MDIKSEINDDHGDPLKIYSKDFTCRTCLSNIKNYDYKNNEQTTTDSELLVNYQEHIILLQLKILPNDDLPQRICSLCVATLNEINLFYSNCQQTQLILNDFFKKQKLLKDNSLITKPLSFVVSNDVSSKSQLIKPLDSSISKSPPPKLSILFDNIKLELENESAELIKSLIDSSPSPSPIQFNTIKLELENKKDEFINLNNFILTNDFPLSCDSCDKTFNNKLNLKQHFNEHLKRVKRICNKCGEEFTKLKPFKDHYLESTCVPSENPMCRICNKVFVVGGIPDLENHLSQYLLLGKLSRTCYFCKETFKTAHNFNKHMNMHKEIKVKNVKMVKIRKCPYCGDNFNTPSRYRYHVDQHKFGTHPFLCDLCGKAFISKERLKLHMQKIHMGIKIFYACKICNKKYRHKKSLTIHTRRIHSNERPFKCEQCEEDFADKELLKFHIDKHNGIKRNKNRKSSARKLETRPSFPYCCHLCDCTFKLPSSLSNHMKIHNEIRKHVCTHCGYGFKLSTSLRKHVNGVHLKLRPFKCEICDRTFARPADRTIHMRQHTGEKPFECLYCKKRFNSQRTLAVHLRFHTGEKPYKCNVCNMGFMTYKILDKHSSNHKLNPDELCL